MANKGIKFKDRDGNSIYPCPYYPVGSIYISVNNTNPSTFFGGTWEQINGKFLLACDTNYTAGSTGGNISTNYTPSGTVEAHTHGAGSLVACYDPKNVYNNALFRVKSVSGGWTLSGYMSESRGWSNGGGSGGRGIEVVGDTGTKQPAFTGTQATINTMPPYLAVYMWKRTA